MLAQGFCIQGSASGVGLAGRPQPGRVAPAQPDQLIYHCRVPIQAAPAGKLGRAPAGIRLAERSQPEAVGKEQLRQLTGRLGRLARRDQQGQFVFEIVAQRPRQREKAMAFFARESK